MAADLFKDTITLRDAERFTGPVSFSMMLKPAGSLCNLDCTYCYYLDKSSIYGGKEPKMEYAMLERVIQDYISANDVPEVQFNWHGGEPMVLGLDFYKKAVEFERKHAGGKKIYNTLQTNGTLIDGRWADFFASNGFLIGISIDGPKDVHDSFRKDKSGHPTFERVMDGISTLLRHGVEFNTMTTVNSHSEGRGLEIYRFLKSLGSRYLQFMPVLEHVKYPLDAKGKEIKSARPYIVDPSEPGTRLARWSVSPVGFGRFLCDIFDDWVRHDVGRFFVGQFDSALANWCGVQPGICAFGQTCGGNATVEHNGDVYPCDHFVYPDYLLGNLCDTPLRDIATGPGMMKFGIDKRNGLPSKCRKCKYLFACNGECPKHRFNATESGETGLNALCEGYRLFYSHVAPYMEKMKELVGKGLPPALIMNI